MKVFVLFCHQDDEKLVMPRTNFVVGGNARLTADNGSGVQTKRFRSRNVDGQKRTQKRKKFSTKRPMYKRDIL